jgi:SNF2 family DNA or RNA helicase
LPILVNLIRRFPQQMDLSQLRNAPPGHVVFARIDNGALLPMPVERLIPILETLTELYDTTVMSDDRLRLPAVQAAQLTALESSLGQQLAWTGGERLRELGRKLGEFQGVRDVTPPAGLQTSLRAYQQQGLNWLQFLREYRLGGLLADDMGLGKTVQTLAHLLLEKESGRMDRPSLVIAPTSLMVNWRMEAQRFAPALRVLVLQGTERKQRFEDLAGHDVVLTTYPLLPRDREILLAQEYHLLILDEAQVIKNPKTMASQIVRELHARHRLCLTGTPMENHLGELWSLLHFLMPGLLGDEKRFRRLFRIPIEKHGDEERRAGLTRRIAPFLLRRSKQDVAKELPAKTEIVRSVELGSAQRDLYESLRLAMHSKIQEEIGRKGMARSHIIILDALLKLRQVCCDPRLVKLDSARRVKNSAKLELLMEMLPELIEEGRRILLFSQFTSMLALIETELDRFKLPYVKLTGDTQDRATPVQRFQSGAVPLFLISLKAGGTGLNLTAADTVIHYDPWWNPAVETQATDRAHRLGQEKPVFVYKLLTAGTVEEKILAMQARKKALAESLFDATGERSPALTIDDLNALFEPLA